MENKPNPKRMQIRNLINRGLNSLSLELAEDIKQHDPLLGQELVLEVFAAMRDHLSFLKEAEEIDPKDLPNNPFTQEDLSKYWEEYVKKIENEGKHNLAAILKIDNPKVTNDNMISLEFPNSTNKIEVERQETDLLQIIRLSLQHDSIDLDISVNESIEKKFVYTNEEKFKKMKEKNPSIELLKKTFNLDL